jgi:aminopeptidase N
MTRSFFFRFGSFAVGSLLVSSASLAGVASGLGAPPIPTIDDRRPLIEAELRAPEPDRGFDEARTVHDEYDVTHYDVDIALDIPSRIITGTITIEATSQVVDLGEVEVDLFTGMSMDSATAGGGLTSFSHVGSVVTVTLEELYQPGEAFTITCSYHGTPSASPFRWLTQNGVPMVLSYSEPERAPAWWVCKDDPKDKATYDIHVTVPDTLFVVSNGLLAGNIDNGDGTRTFDWVTTYPMSTYLFSIAVTNFVKWSDVYTALDGFTTMDVDYYVYPVDLADSQIGWGRNVEMMEYYASIFGEYPFLDEKYAIAEFHHAGAMEHQTCTSMGWNWVRPDAVNDWIVAHELAHSWVGDMITMTDWRHAWTKEGFATYCEALYFEDKFGVTYYHDYMTDMNVLIYAGTRIFDASPPLTSAIYYKGAWVLHMLRRVVGDSAFFDAVLAYTTDVDFRYDVADTEDLRGVFETASGMDLGWFFDEWVYDAGYPVYFQDWSSVAAGGGGYDVSLEIQQIQASGPTFKMPIDVVIETDLGTEAFVVWDSLQTQSFTLHTVGEPSSLDLDPDVWIIREVETVDVAEAMVPGVVLASARPNPFRRATSIGYHLERAENVQLDVYDAAGRWVTRLIDGVRPEGASAVQWTGRDGAGTRVSPGVYFYRLRGSAPSDLRETGRVVMLR